jgi:hypothetical protein
MLCGLVLASCCEDKWEQGVPVDQVPPAESLPVDYQFELEPQYDVAQRAIPIGRAKAIGTIAQPISSSYDVTKRAVVQASMLDKKLGGVLKGFGGVIVSECRKYSVCPLFVTAVMQHESDNGDSKYARKYNNVSGIMKDRNPVRFDDVQQCIVYTVKLLSNSSYAGNSRKTVRAIQQRYCPVGASNDPNGINKYWLTGVQRWMKTTIGESTVLCIAK